MPPGQKTEGSGRPGRRDPKDRGRPVARVSRPTSRRSPWRSPPRPLARSSIFEKMFENRLFFVDKLVAMGARITLCDPHRAIVSGPSRLHGERVESPDIRAGMAILIAALAAEGTIGDREHRPDRPRIRGDRRAPARPRRDDRARRGRPRSGVATRRGHSDDPPDPSREPGHPARRDARAASAAAPSR